MCLWRLRKGRLPVRQCALRSGLRSERGPAGISGSPLGMFLLRPGASVSGPCSKSMNLKLFQSKLQPVNTHLFENRGCGSLSVSLVDCLLLCLFR